jgi:hypothetical protein
VSTSDDAELTAVMRGRYPALLRTATFRMGDAGHGEDLLQTALSRELARLPPRPCSDAARTAGRDACAPRRTALACDASCPCSPSARSSGPSP